MSTIATSWLEQEGITIRKLENSKREERKEKKRKNTTREQTFKLVKTQSLHMKIYSDLL